MNKEDIKVLADLARLELTDADIESYQKDFEGILDYISVLNAVNVDGIEEYKPVGVTNTMREDNQSYESGVFTEDLLASAPERSGEYIKVNKVL